MNRQQFIDEQSSLRKRGFIVSPAHTKSYHRIIVTTPWGVRGSLWACGHHTGEDHACSIGNLANATCWGHVIGTGWGGGPNHNWGEDYGYMVIVRSRSGLYDIGFAHLSAIQTRVGVQVYPGTVVGLTGDSGTNTTGPHLHYEVRPADGRYGSDVSPLHVEHNG